MWFLVWLLRSLGQGIGGVALTVGSVPSRIVPKWRQFDWLFLFNNQRKWRHLGTILRGTDPTVSAPAPIPVGSRFCCLRLPRQRSDLLAPRCQLRVSVGQGVHRRLAYPRSYVCTGHGRHSALSADRNEPGSQGTVGMMAKFLFSKRTSNWSGPRRG